MEIHRSRWTRVKIGCYEFVLTCVFPIWLNDNHHKRAISLIHNKRSVSTRYNIRVENGKEEWLCENGNGNDDLLLPDICLIRYKKEHYMKN